MSENNVLEMKLLDQYKYEDKSVSIMCWSPNGKYLSYVIENNQFIIWDFEQKVIIREFHFADEIIDIAWSPDSQRIAAASFDCSIYILKIDEQEQKTLIGHNNWVNSVSWTPDSKKIATGSADNCIGFWDETENWNLISMVEGIGLVETVSWSPDGQNIAVLAGGTIQIRKSTTNELIYEFNGNYECTMVWSPDSKLIAAIESYTIYILDVYSKTTIKVLKGHIGLVSSMSFSWEGRYLATKSMDNTIRIWSCKTWETVKIIQETHSDMVPSSLDFHPYKPILASLGENDTFISIWQVSDSNIFCPKCKNEVDAKVIDVRIRNKENYIYCQFCGSMISFEPKSLTKLTEQIQKNDNNISELFNGNDLKKIDNFKTGINNKNLSILHLSDLHFDTSSEIDLYITQLDLDLRIGLKLNNLDYIVVTGDISSQAVPEEFELAYKFISEISKRFYVSKNQIILVPGNHDINWDIGIKAYSHVFSNRNVSQHLPQGKYIKHDKFTILRDEEMYKERFIHFCNFYNRLCGINYSLDYKKQGMVFEYERDRILFIILNSSWEIDEFFPKRSSIKPDSIAEVIDKIDLQKHKDWLKIAVWHHPIIGEESLNNEFLDLLAVVGIKLIMHGHIHEAINNFHDYDNKRRISVIGAGTFGARNKEQVAGIPWQYNLLRFDKERLQITVETRKREKVNGPWMADARWQDKDIPLPFYTVILREVNNEP